MAAIGSQPRLEVRPLPRRKGRCEAVRYQEAKDAIQRNIMQQKNAGSTWINMDHCGSTWININSFINRVVSIVCAEKLN